METDPYQMALKLEKAMEHIRSLCKNLDEYGEAKARAIVACECAVAKAAATHRTAGVPATLVKDYAKEDACKERLDEEMATVKYGSLKIKIDAAESILNATQSQNRYLDTFAK